MNPLANMQVGQVQEFHKAMFLPFLPKYIRFYYTISIFAVNEEKRSPSLFWEDDLWILV
jgi:hypothetical protein